MLSLKDIKIPNLKNYTKNAAPKFNKNYPVVIDDAKKWIKNLIINSNLQAYEKFYKIVDHEMLAGYIWAHSNTEGMKVAIDVFNYTFLFDDIAEKSVEDGEKLTKILQNVTKDVNHTDGESEFGKGLKDILLRINSMATPEEYQKFCNSLLEYVNAVINQPKRKKVNEILNYEAYMIERFHTSGVKFTFDLCLITNKIESPESFEKNEIYKKLERAAGECLFITNDIYSFPIEYRNDTHDMNIITIFMKNENLSMQEAFDKAEKMTEEKFLKFWKYKEEAFKLFTCDKVLDNLKRHVECIENIVYGNLEWSMTTLRYKTE